MHIESNVLLKPFTTFKIGGPASFFCYVHNTGELKEAVLFAQVKGLDIFVLGGGSNVLVSDNGFKGLVIKIELKGITFEKRGNDKVEVIAGAGESWDTIVESSVERGLYGIENLSAIPGTVGAAPVQNIGAYGQEIKDVVSFVEVFDPHTMQTDMLRHEDCQFDYRDSFFKSKKGKHLIITKVGLLLNRSGKLNFKYKDIAEHFNKKTNEEISLQDMRKAVQDVRSKKFPDLKVIGTAGSFFKNPIITDEKTEQILKQFPKMLYFELGGGKKKISLGWLLDHVGEWRGYREGNSGIFVNQSMVLVNYKNATAKEIKKLSEKLKKDIKQKVGIDIEEEITFIGN